ncbi:MAG: ABC transporter permease [Candidatus Eisenbacteria bacterium]
MIATRYRKAVRDLARRPGRTLLAVIAMAAGLFQVAVMLTAYALLQPTLEGFHARTRPASATLSVDRIDDSLLARVRALPGVAAAELRPTAVMRVSRPGADWVPAMAHVVEDFDHQQIDLFTRDSGEWPPGAGDVLLERTALRVAGVAVGDSLDVRMGDGRELRVRVAGTVHAPGMAPAWMEHMVPMFVGTDSPLYRADDGSQLRFVGTHPLEEGAIRETADSVRARLTAAAVRVDRVDVPTPGRHPHADQMESFLFLLLAFGLLSVALSTVLLVSMVHALMAEQVQQIGILKTLGATNVQVAGIYLAQVGMLAAAAIALGLPLGTFAGRAYAGFSAGILNTDVSAAPVPWWAVAIEVVLGLALPLAAARAPVRRAAGITVREALADAAPPLARLHALDHVLGMVTARSRPLALTLRATLARRSRLVLTVLLLATGGAVFMAALNVADDWRRSVNDDFARRRYDLMVSFSDRLPVTEVNSLLAELPGATHHESWPSATPWLVGPAGVATVTTAFVAPPPGSPLLAPRLQSGRWPAPGDPEQVVINQAVATRAGGLTVGDSLRLRALGRTHAFAVAGIVRELVPMPIVYSSRAAVQELSGRSPDSTRNVRVVLAAHGDADQRAAARALEQIANERGIGIDGIQRMADAKQGILDHLVIILSVLTLASAVVLFVGVLALTTTLALSVVQRTREFGVMSALGATSAAIATQVWLEAMLLSGLSAIAALVLTVPVSFALEAACGRIFFKFPLDPWISPAACAGWLGLVWILGSLASLVPAHRASRLLVRDALGQA